MVVPERLYDGVGSILSVEVGVTGDVVSSARIYLSCNSRCPDLQHDLAHDINRQFGRIVFHFNDLSYFGGLAQLLAEDDGHVDHVWQKSHQVASLKSGIEHHPEFLPRRSVQTHHVIEAQQLAQEQGDLGTLVEGLSGGHPLGGDVWIGNEEPFGAKGPQVEIEEITEIVLVLDVAAPGVRMSLGREVFLAIGSNRQITEQPGGAWRCWLGLVFRLQVWKQWHLRSLTRFSMSFRFL